MSERGDASVEFLGILVVLVIPVLYIVLAVGQVSAGAMAADAGAREAARILAEDVERQADAEHAVALIAEDFGVGSSPSMSSMCGACGSADGMVEVSVSVSAWMSPRAPACPCGRWSPVGEEGRVGILMCAGCAFVCLLLFVTLALTQVAMQDRRLVSCADALAGAGVGGASASSVLVGQTSGTDEAGAASRVDVALGAMATTTCRVGEGVVVTRVSVQGGEVEVSVKARPRVSLVPPALRGVVIPELERTSSARMRGL